MKKNNRVTESYSDELGASSNHNIVFFASCDSVYFDDWGDNFIRACLSNTQNAIVHINIQNPTNDQKKRLKTLQKKWANFRYSYDIVEFFSKNSHYTGVYAYTKRFSVLFDLLTQYDLPVWVLDIDIFIEKNLDDIVQSLDDVDCGFYQRFHRKELGKKLLAGTLYVNNSVLGREFAQILQRNTKNDLDYGITVEGIDQIEIYQSYKCISKYHPDFRYQPFGDDVFSINKVGNAYFTYPKGPVKRSKWVQRKKGI